ncbi:MAG TPA: magnesium and cobalt transport protein CorA [Solirubrobacteraceae bacterium]|nr:magnesium and cobalt transport protein CorA [Solirubrobacteraceae bacterium]
MIVDCAHYRDGRRQHEGPMELDHAAAICTAEDGAGFVWLGIVEPEPQELLEVQERFGLHDLAVEDAQSFHLRPKVEQYEDDERVLFVVLRTARYDDAREEVDFGEVSVFMSERFVITVRQGVASDLHGARLRLERRPELLAEGPGAVLWAILDKVVDDYAPVVEGLERDIEEVEKTVFSGAAAPTERIYLLRREATDFYRAVHPLLGPLDGMERGAYDLVGPGLRHFFRDVEDHLKLVDEEVVAQRDLLAIILQANMAVVSVAQNEISVRQNETARQLTLIATIFLPLTFITGFFGQNFGWMVEHISSFWAFALLGVVAMAISAAVLYVGITRYQKGDEPLSGGRSGGG